LGVPPPSLWRSPLRVLGPKSFVQAARMEEGAVGGGSSRAMMAFQEAGGLSAPQLLSSMQAAMECSMPPVMAHALPEVLAGHMAALPHQSIVEALQVMAQPVVRMPPMLPLPPMFHHQPFALVPPPPPPPVPKSAPAAPPLRCAYAHCHRSQNPSNRFYKIEAGRTSGGQDWSPLVGYTLCTTCYCRYERTGTLERSVNKPIPSTIRSCCYPNCDRPDQSSQFYLIEEGRKSGGQDWSSMVGWVLCKSCYTRFEQRGTLKRSVNKPLPPSMRRCSYPHCDRPEHGRAFFQIEANRKSGGQDWGPLTGWVLCQPCYKRYKDRGTLERSQNKPLDASARQCTYEGCDRQGTGGGYFQIEEGKTAGGQDWSPLTGSVLCQSCYERYKNSGSLQRTRPKPLPPNLRRCTYEKCLRPEESSRFYQIQERGTAGGQDWSPVACSVLCKSCYSRYERQGTLERQKPRKPSSKGKLPRANTSALKESGAGGAFTAVVQKQKRSREKSPEERGEDKFASLVQFACAEREQSLGQGLGAGSSSAARGRDQRKAPRTDAHTGRVDKP